MSICTCTSIFQSHIDKLREEKEEIIRKKEDKMEQAKAEVSFVIPVDQKNISAYGNGGKRELSYDIVNLHYILVLVARIKIF